MTYSAEQRAVVNEASRIKREARKAATKARPKSPKADRGRERDNGFCAYRLFTINADGALAIIDQAAADRASHEALSAQIKAREAEIDALTKALTGLTCGGSEFYIRKGERFVADIPACVAWVRRAKLDAHRRSVEAIKGQKKAEAQIKARDERIAALEEIVSLADELINGGGLVNRGVDRGLVVVEKADKSDPHYRLCTALERRARTLTQGGQ
jgi:hypothetical protein